MNNFTDKFDRSALVRELELCGGEIKGSAVKCPFHDDQTSSGSIYQRTNKDGSWAYMCHGCSWRGDVYDIRKKRLGNSPKRGGKYRKNRFTAKQVWQFHTQKGSRVWLYEYKVDNHPRLLIVRCEKDKIKKFYMMHWEDNYWVPGAPPKPWTLYNQDTIRTCGNVIVVEGEKAVEALAKYAPDDFVVTTSPGGSNSPDSADWRVLSGKVIYLWPDNDTAGIKYIRKVCAILKQAEPLHRFFFINPKSLGLEEHGDAYDLLKNIPESDRHQAVRSIMEKASLLK